MVAPIDKAKTSTRSQNKGCLFIPAHPALPRRRRNQGRRSSKRPPANPLPAAGVFADDRTKSHCNPDFIHLFRKLGIAVADQKPNRMNGYLFVFRRIRFSRHDNQPKRADEAICEDHVVPRLQLTAGGRSPLLIGTHLYYPNAPFFVRRVVAFHDSAPSAITSAAQPTTSASPISPMISGAISSSPRVALVRPIRAPRHQPRISGK